MTTTTTDTPATTVQPTRRLPWLRLVAAFAVGLVIAGVASVAAVYLYQQQYVGRVIPGVRVGQVDLSGLDAATARARLVDAYRSLGDGRIVVDVGAGRQEGFTFEDARRRIDADQLVNRAIGVGRSGAPLQMVLDQIRTLTRGEVIAPDVTFDPAAVADRVHRIAQAALVKSVDATVVATARDFATTPAKDGSMIDEATAATDIVTALSQLDAPTVVSIAAHRIVVAPAVSDDAAFTARARAIFMAEDVVLGEGGDVWSIPAAKVHNWITFGGAGADYGPLVKRSAVQAAIVPLAKQVNQTPKEATFLLGKDGKVIGATKSRDGRTLNVPDTVDLVSAAIAGRPSHDASSDRPLQLSVAVVKPKLTSEDAQKIAPLMRPISTWTTYYISGPHNGFSANISVPALAIDGTVLAPGESFDFWNAIGEVSLARGYKLGGAIVDGRTVEGKTLGGGICSCSTTLFNAALRAGYQMGSRKNHYYYISRYPLGLDATVFDSGYGTRQTMAFTNDTQYPLLIRAFAKPGTVRFTIYSVPTGRTVEISKPIVKNVLPATTITQYTTSLAPGVRKQIEWPATGMDVWVTVTVRDSSGTIIHQTTYYSHYGRVTGIILVGQAAPAPTEPPPAP